MNGKIKRISVIILAILFTMNLAGCSSENKVKENDIKVKESTVVVETTAGDSGTESGKEEIDSSVAEIEAGDDSAETVLEIEDAKTLVIYFSATGTTKSVAGKIASVTGADLYEIVPKEPYTDADLNYNDSSTRATREQNDPDARPEFEPIEIDIENTYSTIFIGFPIWWGQEPRIMDTFVESYDFSGITVIPFCTSGSSGIGNSGNNLSEKAGSGKWLDGNRFSGTVTEDDLKSWISELDI